jgi:hypothetical protein
MRRLLLGIALLLLSFAAVAQPHEALLTPGGTLFTLDEQISTDFPDLELESNSVLVLRSRQGAEADMEIVPATAHRGRHTSPAMAYENESGMLFVFWIRHTGIMYNELVFASRDREGVWSEATTFGDPYDFRENLRIAVTRRISASDEEGSAITVSGVTVHATWWEFDSVTGTEGARYAMLTLDNGAVASVEYLDLAALVPHELGSDQDADLARFFADATISPEERVVLRQPLLFASPKQDSMLVVFGDYATHKINQVRIFPTRPPVSDGRLRVPIGRSEGGSGAPKFDVAANSRIEGIYGDTDRIALYTRDGNTLRYVVLRDGEWSDPKPIVLDEKVTSGAAIDALRRLLAEH